VWSIYLGGGNVELYTRQLSRKGFRAFEELWRDLGHARRFLEQLPLARMSPANDRLAGEPDTSYCLALPGEVYAVYLNAGPVSLDLSADSGTFRLRWYDVRTGLFADGGSLQAGALRELGPPPFPRDVAALLTRIP
jgi:hypothetical protein